MVRFCVPVTSESHTRHQLDKRSDEVRLRLSHSGAHRPQTLHVCKLTVGHVGKRYHLKDGSWNYVVSCSPCRDSDKGLAAAARQIAHKWKSGRFGIGKCIP